MLTIDGHHLTIAEVAAVAREHEPVRLADASRERMLRSHRWVEQILHTGKAVYGINTGFGIFADRRISPEQAAQLSRNLILSHAVGTGDPLPEEVVRAAMLIRANTLALGVSGVRPVVVETLIEMLNHGVTPEVPSQGSMGSSGDLAPLAHLGLVLTAPPPNASENYCGWATYRGKRMHGCEAMRAAGIRRVVLGPKEGLAITNGATFSAAVLALAVYDSAHWLDIAEIALSMSLEALLGASNAFDERIHRARRHPGQIAVARRVRELTAESTLIDAGGRVQDAYSLRTAPQVQGAARDTWAFVSEVARREINAVTDNPLIFSPTEALSGGNFHGEPVAMAADFLAIAMSEVAAIAERRIFRLTDGKLNYGLPSMLADTPEAAGLNSGLMMPQYTAASLVLENQTLSSPDSTRSLPTSGEQEDHNANAMTAARHARAVVRNTAHVLAIEAYTAARAIDLRLRQMPEARLGRGTATAHRLIRERVPYQPGDAWWAPEIEETRALLATPEFLQAVLTAANTLPSHTKLR